MKEMSNWLKVGSFQEKDEYYTPPILVEAILPFIPISSTIWCPFDTDESEFVVKLRERGNKVIATHIWNGQDFFTMTKPECDCIVSNPPFSSKLKVLERLYDLGKPFAMVMGLPILNYQEIGNFFYEKQQSGKNLQLLIVDKKVSFDGKTASFNNSYFCYNILPKDLMFAHLNNNNSGANFKGSRMKKTQTKEIKK